MPVDTMFFLGVLTVQLILFVIMVVTDNLSVKYLKEKDKVNSNRYDSISDFCFYSIIALFIVDTVVQIIV